MSVQSSPSDFAPLNGFTASDPRADGAVRQVAFENGRVVIARRMRGVPMRLDIPCSAYRGVVLVLGGTPDEPHFTIRLDHFDPDLSVVVHEADDDADVVAQWRAWAKLTNLPKLLEQTPGVLETAERHLGAVQIGRVPAQRRRGASAIKRRPRFLTRRRVGERKLMKRVVIGREIIARS